MANVYRQDSQRLHELLEKASAPSGATMLIPDLQRPYVWTPNQVTLLIDSLIKGWPFGTLLLWKVNHQELQGIPFRPFWRVVDRAGESNSVQVSQMNPPAEYHMILDGQQRVQSLLLALGGDDWGFTLEDRDWTEEINDRRSRGRQAKYRHWTKASLCFDLKKFIGEYNKQQSKSPLLTVDFREVLVWAITDPQDGQSSFEKAETYQSPLRRAYAAENQQCLVRLSRLWKEAQPNPGLKEKQFQQILRPLLEQHGLAPDGVTELLPPMGELMTTLRDVKLSDVTFLELQPFDPQTSTRDTYNDAIVNVFTRLNTAGRTLTREEITLAWLKVGWETDVTAGKPAGGCFEELRNSLEDEGLALEIDELVRAASFVWSVSNNDGRLLANSDLLKGNVIRPMASALSQRWAHLQDAFVAGAKALAERGLSYGPSGSFSSLYALDVLWAWLFTAEMWKADHPLGELQRDAFEKRCSESTAKYLDRWIMCSQWAGVWSGSSITTIEAFAKTLAETLKNLVSLGDPVHAHTIWDETFGTLIEGLGADAISAVTNLSSPTRERVGLYRSYLWIWHRLERDRWMTSQIQLRVGKSRTNWDVDHTVPISLWNTKFKSETTDGITPEDAAVLINRIGNCALLEKNFNISKGGKGLKFFLASIHEVQEKKLRMDDWCAALAIPRPMLDPDTAALIELKEAIERRDNEIKTELIEFIRGQKVRVDVPTPLSAKLDISVAVPSVTPQTSINGSGQSLPELPSDSVLVSNDLGETQGSPPFERPFSRLGIDLLGLRAAYREDASLQLIVDHFASRQRNQSVTELDSFSDALERAGTASPPRSALIHTFRRLDALGLGRFIPGRKGYSKDSNGTRRPFWFRVLLRRSENSQIGRNLRAVDPENSEGYYSHHDLCKHEGPIG